MLKQKIHIKCQNIAPVPCLAFFVAPNLIL